MRGEPCKTPGCVNVSLKDSSWCRSCRYQRTKEALGRSVLKTGGAAVAKRKAAPPMMTEEEQRSIDLRCVAIDRKRENLPLDPPRRLSRAEINDLENRGLITPVEMIPFSESRFTI